MIIVREKVHSRVTVNLVFILDTRMSCKIGSRFTPCTPMYHLLVHIQNSFSSGRGIWLVDKINIIHIYLLKINNYSILRINV